MHEPTTFENELKRATEAKLLLSSPVDCLEALTELQEAEILKSVEDRQALREMCRSKDAENDKLKEQIECMELLHAPIRTAYLRSIDDRTRLREIGRSKDAEFVLVLAENSRLRDLIRNTLADYLCARIALEDVQLHLRIVPRSLPYALGELADIRTTVERYFDATPNPNVVSTHPTQGPKLFGSIELAALQPEKDAAEEDSA